MPFNPINYGNILAQTEGIQGARMNNALAARQLDPNSTQNQLARAKIAELQAKAQGGGDPTAPMRNYSERQRLIDAGATPEQIATFDNYVRAQQIRNLGGVDTIVGAGGYGNTPLSTQEAEANWERYQRNQQGVGEALAGQGVDLSISSSPAPLRSEAERAGAKQAAIEAEKNKAAVKGAYSLEDTKSVIQAQNKLGIMLTQDQKLDKVIELSENGAKTGPLMRYLPTLTAETAELENMQRGMGLDVVGSVTFGALSKGELDLALVTALPTNLSGPDLVKWARDKQAANRKLGEYLMEQIKFIRGGGTTAEWLDQVQNAGGINATSDDYAARRARILGQ